MDEIQRELARRADAKTKQWWEKYLRGAIPFRGVPMAAIREVITKWAKGRDRDEIRATALELLRQEHAEDKIAGILLFAEILHPTHRDICTRFCIVQRLPIHMQIEWQRTNELRVQLIRNAPLRVEECIRLLGGR